jgi:hypothetical protein
MFDGGKNMRFYGGFSGFGAIPRHGKRNRNLTLSNSNLTVYLKQ